MIIQNNGTNLEDTSRNSQLAINQPEPLIILGSG
jgi:hypothetical protein